MNDEPKQNAPVGENSPEERRAALAIVDQKVTNNSLRIARYLIQSMNVNQETAEDLKQSALLKYFQIDENSRIQIRDPDAFLYRLMKNQVLNWKRQGRSVKFGDMEPLKTEDLERWLNDTSYVNYQSLLRKIWSEVKDEDRRLFELLMFTYTGKEIARRLGIPEDTARQRIARLKAKIEKILEENRISG